MKCQNKVFANDENSCKIVGNRYYLTNIKPFYKIAEAVEEAAKASGMRVSYHPEPMPAETGSCPEQNSRYGSISTLDIGKNHQSFWNIFDGLRGK
jgi:hypothetical protein